MLKKYYIFEIKKPPKIKWYYTGNRKKTYFKEKINTILKRALPNEFLAKITKYNLKSLASRGKTMRIGMQKYTKT